MKIIAKLILPVVLAAVLVACNNADSNGKTDATWRTGIALYSFHKHPFSTAIAMADSAGVKEVEGFSFYKLGAEFQDSVWANINAGQVEQMKKIMDEKGMTLSSMYVGDGDVDVWKNYFDMAKKFGATYLVAEPQKAQWDMIDSLAGVFGMKLAIHEHAKEISAYWHPDSVLAAIKGHKNFGACADLGHWVRSGLNPVECLKKLEGHIIGVHFKDVDANGADVNPGSGTIDFSAVAAELKRQNYTGILHVECEHNMDDNLQDVKEYVEFIRKMGEEK